MPEQMTLFSGRLPPVFLGVCYACGKPIAQYDCLEKDGEHYCHDCSFSCDDCGRTLLESAATEDSGWCLLDDGRQVCAEHTSECADCGDRCHVDSMVNLDDGRDVCTSCAEGYCDCVQCGVQLAISDTQDRDGYAVCLRCLEELTTAEEEEEDDSLLHGYSYKPYPRFYHADNEIHGREGYGVELEVDSTSETRVCSAGSAIDSAGLPDCYYCKEDGSLDNGFEVVSHPGTWNWWKGKADLSWMDSVRDNGYRSYNTTTCGMHVHVSRSLFTSVHLFKLLEFFSRNPEFVFRISRRRSVRAMNAYAAVYCASPLSLYRSAKAGGGDRYRAINLQPHNTVEFRMFRGTLNKTAFLRNLAFVHAIIAFTKQANRRHLTESHFAKWLRLNAKRVLGDVALADSLCAWVCGVDSISEVAA